MGKPFVNKKEFESVAQLARDIEEGKISFKQQYDKDYARDLCEEFMHSWTRLQAVGAKHANDICRKTYNQLANINLIQRG